MDKEIIIGTGKIGYSAAKINDYVSENESSYWIVDCLFNVPMVVFKTTEEGKKIGNILKKDSPTLLKNYLDNLVLKNINLIQVRNSILHQSEIGYVKGQEDLRNDFKKLLKIN